MDYAQVLDEEDARNHPANSFDISGLRYNAINHDYQLPQGKIIASSLIHEVVNVLSARDATENPRTVFIYHGVDKNAAPQIAKDWKKVVRALNNETVPHRLYHHNCYLNFQPGTEKQNLYIVTDLIHGTLSSVANETPFTVLELTKMLKDISETLSNRLAYEHRGINPDTITVCIQDSGIKEFQLSNWNSWSNLTESREIIKEQYRVYQAPEFEEEKSDHNPIASQIANKCDVYSLGIVFLEMLGFSKEELMSYQTKQIFVQEEGFGNDCEGHLKRLLLNAVSCDQSKRPTIGQLRSRVETIYKRQDELSQITVSTLAQGIRDIPLQYSFLNGSFMNAGIEVGLLAAQHEENKIEEDIPLEGRRSRRGRCDCCRKLGLACATCFSINRKCCKSLGQCFLISTLLSLAVLSIIVLVNRYEYGADVIEGIQGGVNGISRNIGIPPFVDIQLTTTGFCYNNSYSLLNLGYWPGTLKFCYDNSVIDPDNTGQSCGLIYPSAPGENFTSWKGYSFCVKYANSYYPINSGNCPSGYSTCSQGKLCVSGSICPVTNISITNSPLNGTNATSSPMSNGQYFNFLNLVDQTPIGNMQVIIGQDTPCLSENEYPGQMAYPAIAQQPDGCSTYGVYPNSSMIDTVNATTALDYQRWGPLFSWLPQFLSTYNSQSAYLTFSPRLQLSNNSNCTGFDPTLLNSVPDFMLYSNRITAGFAITIVALVSAGCLGSLLACCSGFKPRMTLGGLSLIAAILLLPVAIITNIQKSRMVKSIAGSSPGISSSSLSHCFQSTNANQVISDLLSVFNNMSSISSLWLAMVIVAWVLGGLGIVILLYLKCTKKKLII